jgi:hypothetical protein
MMDSNLTIKKSNITSEIKVSVQIPDNVSEHIKQQKINIIYDILNPEKIS